MKKRALALLLSVLMTVSVLPISVTAASDVYPPAYAGTTVMHNTNQGDGIILAKYAQPHLDANGNPDGSVDIVIQTHTTGRVHTVESAVPTDIVLVLDLSGSMEEEEGGVTVEEYVATYATATRYGNRTYYTVSSTANMYMKGANGTYTRVRSGGYDNNGYQYYTYGSAYNATRIYPELATGVIPSASRQYDYDVVQLYALETRVVTAPVSRIDTLKEAVDAFISNTAAYNSTLTDEAQMHRIALVKFGTADYYNDSNLIAEGDNKNNSGYNYTQVVKNFTTVDDAGETELINAMNALEPGGATAVDYGMNLATELFKAAEGTEAAEGRNKVVVVVTDGAPTHSSNYSASVAGSAINYANELKSENVIIYTISVVSGADSTQLGNDNTNRFMHYLSNNYPDASYSNGNITAGTGSPSNGYYLTPDETNGLSMIFDSISAEIDELSIKLGEEAHLVDTVSEFFTIPDGVQSITVATADKTATGWKEAQVSSLVPTISGNTVTVSGFDFDENYVSTDPRDGDFYGRMLILAINVVPNSATIDIHADEIVDGLVPTNEGAAEVMSGTTAVAKVESPTVKLNKITYTVEGENNQPHACYYRLAGAEHTLLAEPAKEGHTFIGWTTPTDITVQNGKFIMPAKDVEIVGRFTANTYTVSYQYVGLEVDGRPALPDSHDETYGATVSVSSPTPTLNGYTFIGWYPQDEGLGASSLTSFTMPDHDVVLLGRFVPGTNTAYTVNHYTENLPGAASKFTLEDTENLSGTTGEAVAAAPKDYTGFTFDEDYDDGTYKTVMTGTVDANGNLVLNLYYLRNEWTLTYEYVGTVPADAAPSASVLDGYSKTYKYGETVTVNPDAEADGYVFTGWYSTGGTVTPTTPEFDMPNHDVTLHGYFSTRTDVTYKVKHFFEDERGNFIFDDTKTETFRNGVTGNTVVATPLNVQYYVFDADNPDNFLSAPVKGDGTLELEVYYERTSYKVTYDYEGIVPTDADPAQSALPARGGEYKWGQTVTTVAVVPTAAGHAFHGWYYNGDPARTPVPASFEMPKNDVEIRGHFDPTEGLEYYVKHYFEDESGNYVHNPDYNETFKADLGQTVTAAPLNIQGYVYNAGKSTATGVVPSKHEEALTLELYYDYASYKVTYLYEGAVPGNASELPDEAEYEYKSTVNVKPDASAPGYDFKGWYRNNDASKTEITSFEMPSHNVELAGRFVARNDTPYKVEHYLETAVDGVYESTPYKTDDLFGTTGTEVTATPIGITGYTYNQTESAATRTAVIAGNGSTVLKLYYDRNSYKVTYVYSSAPASAVLPTDANAYAHGTSVTVKNATDVAGYTFSGWSAEGITVSGGTSLGGGTFVMPMTNVIFVGSYTAKESSYTVEHWVEDPNTGDYKLHGAPEVRKGETDQFVTAVSHVIHGYTYNPDITESNIPTGSGIEFADTEKRTTLKGKVSADGTLTLKFYYTADSYDVIYIVEGAVIPTGVVQRDSETHDFGTEVTIRDEYSVPGYTFSGWDTADISVSGDEFTMPAHTVTFRGSFTPDLVEYTIKYWQQVLEGTGTKEHNGKYYDEVVADRVDNLTAITGHHVSAYPDYIKTYEGFTATPEDNNEYYGIVTADDPNTPEDESLVLNLYYDRLTYSVTYIYAGTAPEGVVIPSSYNKASVMYGATVEVEDKLDDYDGFPFDGWHSNSVDVSNGADSFTMPAKNVVLYGRHDAEYTVTYYVDEKVCGVFTVKPGAVHDIIGAPSGIGVFSGWSDPYNVKLGEYFDADDLDFIMPWSNVEIRGTFSMIIPPIARGTLTISKTVVAPEGFEGKDTYTFDIYKITGDTEKLTETVEVKAGESVSVKLSTGEYIVKEREASVDGYTHTTVCDDEDATVTVSKNKVTEISFTNTYEEILLERDDHFGYIIGYPDGTVRPEANITRAEVVTIFFRMFTDSARDSYWAQTNKFTDVKDTDWYNTAISTLANAGVLDGYTDGTFKPNDTITRAELIKIATSFYDTTAGKDSEFSDIKLHWAESFIEEAYKLGIVDGYGDGTFHPDQAVTRAEAMKIVNRTLEREPHKDMLLDSMIKWPDNADPEKWYYAEVQEATNSHDYDMVGDYEKWTALLPMRDWAALELTWREEHDGE